MDATPASGLTDLEFHQITGRILASIESTVDAWLQDDVIDIDARRTGGLLEMSFPNGSTIVINTQPPLHELWLAARAGGYHFRHHQGAWTEREGHEFFALLSQRASEQAGQPLRFEPLSA
jgi:CyaY protein